MGASELTSEEERAALTRLARHYSKQHVESDGFQDELKQPALAKKPVKTKLAGWKHFVAGGVAGAAEVVCTMPLDVVKTQMQVNSGKYTGPINAAVQIHKTGGVRALYYGMPAFLTQTSAKAAIRFFGFAQCKDLLTKVVGEDTAKDNMIKVNFFSGLGAGAMEAAIWTTPTERLKVLRQSEAATTGKKKYNSTLGTAKIVVQEHGFRGLFVGIVPCVIRQASSVGVRFMLYDPVKKVLNTTLGMEDGVGTFMLAGGTVGALSVIINNPVDVVKNIQQAGSRDGFFKICQTIMSEDGPKGFFRGLSARVPRVFAGQAITFAVYEQMAKVLLAV